MDHISPPNPSHADDSTSISPSQTRKALAIALGLSGILFAVYLWILVSPLFRRGKGLPITPNTGNDSSRAQFRRSQPYRASHSKGASTAGPSTTGAISKGKASIFADLSGHPTLCSPPPTYTRRASWEGHRPQIQNDTFCYPPSYRNHARGLHSDSAYDLGCESDGHLSRIRSSLGSVPVILRPSTPDNNAVYDSGHTLGNYDTQDLREPELPPGLLTTAMTSHHHVEDSAENVSSVANPPAHLPRANGTHVSPEDRVPAAENFRGNMNYPPNQTVVRSGAVLPQMVADHIKELPAAYRPRPSRAEFINAVIPPSFR